MLNHIDILKDHYEMRWRRPASIFQNPYHHTFGFIAAYEKPRGLQWIAVNDMQANFEAKSVLIMHGVIFAEN